MIIHVDMDAFYASVEIREQPELVSCPVVVGGREGRGVVAAANYIARKFGVRSAMPIAEAKRRCKNLVCLPVRMPLYVEASQKINEVFYHYTPEIEPLSLDEAFLDVTASEHLFKSAENIGQMIKHDILKETKLVCSVGIANNKYVAKIASDINKPDGFVYVSKNKQQQFLDPLPVSRLWGAGKVTQKKFSQYGIETIGDVRNQSAVFMQSIFGNLGQHFLALANGRDARRVSSERKTKSISHETTFEQDVDDMLVLRAYLADLCEQVAARLRIKQYLAKTVNIKLRYPDFKTITRAVSLDSPDNNTDILLDRAVALFSKTMQQNKSAIRLIGVGVSGLINTNQQTEGCENTSSFQQEKQIDMFESQNNNTVLKKQKNIDKIADEVNRRFGKKTVRRGRSYHK
ncbi:DNA polymerase IV [hydrothermal vent metagenome]|uniref:DNA-directed DNA polymerase n=1 Tax=hydrothermal vent metagenome TaxID=652676 RepID=A0A3B0ZXN1_9ZZZZ